MAESSRVVDARSRKSLTVMLQALAKVGLKAIADPLGVDISTAQRTDWEAIAIRLTALGLKPVPVEARCVLPDDFAFMRKATIERLQQTDEGDTGIDWSGVR